MFTFEIIMQPIQHKVSCSGYINYTVQKKTQIINKHEKSYYQFQKKKTTSLHCAEQTWEICATGLETKSSNLRICRELPL